MTPTQILGASLLCTILGLVGGGIVFGAKALICLGKIAEKIDYLKELPKVITEMRNEFQKINDRVTRLESRWEAQDGLLQFPRHHKAGESA